MTRGFSLVELLVALVILQIGMLAVAALTVQAQATVRDAERSERADWAVRTVADSLVRLQSPRAGVRVENGVRLRWVAGPGHLLLTVEASDGAPEAAFRLPAAGPE